MDTLLAESVLFACSMGQTLGASKVYHRQNHKIVKIVSFRSPQEVNVVWTQSNYCMHRRCEVDVELSCLRGMYPR